MSIFSVHTTVCCESVCVGALIIGVIRVRIGVYGTVDWRGGEGAGYILNSLCENNGVVYSITAIIFIAPFTVNVHVSAFASVNSIVSFS